MFEDYIYSIMFYISTKICELFYDPSSTINHENKLQFYIIIRLFVCHEKRSKISATISGHHSINQIRRTYKIEVGSNIVLVHHPHSHGGRYQLLQVRQRHSINIWRADCRLGHQQQRA